MDLATLGAGCFWCVEAIFRQVVGISDIACGYSGGLIHNPSYEKICSGSTEHAEVVQFKYDSDIISYEEILDFFWLTHDPTTINRQGANIGSQYRSVIFYHTDSQKKVAEKLKRTLNQSRTHNSDIITEIVRYGTFYIAEEYHQDYFNKNPNIPYCSYVIKPKIKKFLSKQIK